MKKLIISILAITMLLRLCACTKNNPDIITPTAVPTSAVKKTDIDVSSLGNSILELIKNEEPLTLEKSSIAELYYIDEADISEAFGAITMTSAFPGEIIVIKASNADAVKKIEEAFNRKLDDVMVQSADYDEENLALAKTCKVQTEGNYVSLFIHAKHAQMEALFTEAFN